MLLTAERRMHRPLLQLRPAEYSSRGLLSSRGLFLVRSLAGLLVVAPLWGCGSRSALRGGPAQCEVDEDCDQSRLCLPQTCVAQHCVAEPLDCGPNPACELLACNPETGSCESFPLAQDLDRDGFNGPLPGFAPGATDSCGDDCDDTSALAYPGGTEICDGTDNDCDGTVDNGALYLQLSSLPEPQRLDQDSDTSSRKGFAYGDGIFAAGYWGNKYGSRSSWLTAIDESSLEPIWTQEAVLINAESFGGDLVWSGNAFGSTWSDLRFDANYEVFFNRFNKNGDKLGPDVRITTAPGMSTQSIIRFDQGRYVLLWADKRAEFEGAGPRVFAQVVNAEGRIVGNNRQISSDDQYAEGPDFAATSSRYGVVYTDSPGPYLPDEGNIRLEFVSLDKEFADRKSVRLADEQVKEPRIIAALDRFVVVWSLTPGRTARVIHPRSCGE
jgi:hypothetical protein